MPHWVYLLSAANGLIGLAAWRNLPLAIIRLVGALTKDPERSKRCAEMLRLARKDAKDLPSYLIDNPRNVQAPATAARRSRNEISQPEAPSSSTTTGATLTPSESATTRSQPRRLQPADSGTPGKISPGTASLIEYAPSSALIRRFHDRSGGCGCRKLCHHM